MTTGEVNGKIIDCDEGRALGKFGSMKKTAARSENSETCGAGALGNTNPFWTCGMGDSAHHALVDESGSLQVIFRAPAVSHCAHLRGLRLSNSVRVS